MMTSYLNRLQSLLQQEQREKGRAIIFWIEDEGEWTVEALQHVLGDRALVRLLDPNQSLKLKREIERQNVQSSFVLYSPIQLSEKELDSLLSLRLVGVDFQHDDIYAWAERFKTDEWTLRQLKEQYPLFFAANTRLNKLEKYRERYPDVLFDERVLVYVTVNSKPSVEDAFLQMIKMGTKTTGHKHYKELQRLGLLDPFIHHMKDAFGVKSITNNLFLQEGIDTIIAASYLRDGGSPIENLENRQSTKINRLAELYNKSMMSTELKSQWFSWTDSFVERYDIRKQMANFKTQQLVCFKSLTVADDLLLDRIWQEASETQIHLDINHLKPIVEQRLAIELVQNNEMYRMRYQFWKSYIALRAELNKVIRTISIRPPTADSLYKNYIEEAYKLDQYVRSLYNSLRLTKEERYQDLYKIIQIRYEREWVEPLANHATAALKQTESPTSLQKQTEFYQTFVQMPNLQTKARQYVIISDGFRYEAGKELASQLQYEPDCHVSCEAMLASLPSYTQLGMASLLPQLDALSIRDNKQVYIGGMSTAGLQQRERILKAADEQSVVFKLSDFMNLMSRERKERVKGKNIVYLYHDVIDAVGDKMTTEHNTFDMTSMALNELHEAIHTLLHMDAKRITITADHGFLYLSERATAASKVLNERAQLLDGNNRFQMQRKEAKSLSIEYGAFRLNEVDQVLPDTETIIAEGLNRFRTGAGTCYFHGGVTPQERVIPVIVVEARQGMKRIEVSVVDNSWIITDLNPKFLLYQVELLSDQVLPTTIRCSLWMDGERVSNERIMTCQAKTKQQQEQIIDLFLFEQDYPLHGTLTLLLEIPGRNGQWERYKTYEYKVSILGGMMNG